MGKQSTTYPPRRAASPLWTVLASMLLAGLGTPLASPQTISALTVPLLLPTSVAFDAQGNLYLAETNNHVIRRVDPTGVLTTVAGNGTQGFSGDNGPATAAALDSPTSVLVDGANNLYIADAHNHRIRKVDAATGNISTVAGEGTARFAGDGGPATLASLNLPSALAIDPSGALYIADSNNQRIRKLAAGTGVITTFAGNGQQGFAGDGGPATSASIDSPSGLAVDAAGNLYLADTHNHRVRMVNSTTGFIATVAGTGLPGFAGDQAAAAGAALALPQGLSFDAAGNLYIADANNQRIRRITPDGTITTVAGDGTQALLGDGGAAVAAGINTPRATAISPAGLVTLADTGDGRVRQVNPDTTINTVAGLGVTVPGALVITAPAVLSYGTGALTAILATTSPATGRITFLESTATGVMTLGSSPLSGNTATLSTAALAAGTHRIFTTYSGDLTHASAQSVPSVLTISPSAVSASVDSAAVLYGQPLPPLAGSLTGVLAQDAGSVSLVLSVTAAALSPAGVYPIAGALSGPAAGNYVLSPVSGATLTIQKAPSTATVSAASSNVTMGVPVSLTAQVASTTSGTPTGRVLLLDGGALLETLPLSTTGAASVTTSTLTQGVHALSASYTGDANFTGSLAPAQVVTIGPAVSGDFALTATGQTSQSVASGSAASFTFAVQMQGAALSSPITLAASVLPAGTTASFSPSYLPPGGAVTAFTLTVQTSKVAAASLRRRTLGAALALLLPWLLPFGRRRARRLASGGIVALLLLTAGCGDRIFTAAKSATAIASYPITVSATATSPTGAVLLHTAIVTLSLQ